MDQDASWTSTITVDYLQQHNVAYQSVLRQVPTDCANQDCLAL